MKRMKWARTFVPLIVLMLGEIDPASATRISVEGSEQAAQVSPSRGQRLVKEQDNIELQKVAPFKLFDNLYYVGVGFVASYLLTTDEGLVLIDAGTGWRGDAKAGDPYVDHLIEGIQKLGFNPKDVRYVLVTHAHYDHIGGAAKLQEMYGARVGMLEGDWQLLASGGAGAVRAPRRDLVLKPGETLRVGKTALRLSAVPGHTPGMLVIETTLYDGGKPYTAYIGSFPAAPGGPGGGTGPQVEEQYAANVRHVQQMKDISIFLPMHWAPEYWEHVDTLARRRAGEPHPLIAPNVFRERVARLPAPRK